MRRAVTHVRTNTGLPIHKALRGRPSIHFNRCRCSGTPCANQRLRLLPVVGRRAQARCSRPNPAAAAHKAGFMVAPPYNVLFLCTGNSARSILAEALLDHLGQGRFKAYSAGSFPTGRVNPLALALLEEKRLPVEGLRSKSWDEFAQTDSPQLHFIFTVCDHAAAESCPIWPGHPVTAHWGIPDP